MPNCIDHCIKGYIIPFKEGGLVIFERPAAGKKLLLPYYSPFYIEQLLSIKLLHISKNNGDIQELILSRTPCIVAS